jgi:microcystin-dependent protein
VANQFIGELRVFSFGFAPRGWAQCNGQILAIAQNQALFALYGTAFGGDGVRTFGLPNLQGRVAIHQAPGLPIGVVGGEQAHTLTLNELPKHNHFVSADTVVAAPDGQNPAPNRVLAQSSGVALYGPAGALAPMAPGAIGMTGGSQPHDNMSPYTVLNVCVALTGIFPSPN